MQEKLFDTGWSKMKASTKACHQEEGTDKHRLYHCPVWNEVRHQIPDFLQKVGAKSEDFKERVEVAKRYRRAPSK